MKGIFLLFLVSFLVFGTIQGRKRKLSSLFKSLFKEKHGKGLYSIQQIKHAKGKVDLDMIVKLPDDRETGFPKRRRRAAYEEKKLKWPNSVVPYAFSKTNETSTINKDSVLKAIEKIEESTCVKFVPKVDQVDFISIDGLEEACYSYVGRIGGKQRLNLGQGCEGVGVALHELLHALGFLHEHNRPDRDDYVLVNKSNIAEGAESSFEKYTYEGITSFGIDYDRQSVMHYENFAFTNKPVSKENDQEAMTLISKGPLGKDEILGNNNLSPKDIERIKSRYCSSDPTQTTNATFSTKSGASTTHKPTTPDSTSTPVVRRTKRPKNKRKKKIQKGLWKIWKMLGGSRKALDKAKKIGERILGRGDKRGRLPARESKTLRHGRSLKADSFSSSQHSPVVRKMNLPVKRRNVRSVSPSPKQRPVGVSPSPKRPFAESRADFGLRLYQRDAKFRKRDHGRKESQVIRKTRKPFKRSKIGRRR